jgi:hypothetical protein
MNRPSCFSRCSDTLGRLASRAKRSAALIENSQLTLWLLSALRWSSSASAMSIDGNGPPGYRAAKRGLSRVRVPCRRYGCGLRRVRALAQAAGAEVLVRQAPEVRGEGQALLR